MTAREARIAPHITVKCIKPCLVRKSKQTDRLPQAPYVCGCLVQWCLSICVLPQTVCPPSYQQPVQYMTGVVGAINVHWTKKHLSDTIPLDRCETHFTQSHLARSVWPIAAALCRGVALPDFVNASTTAPYKNIEISLSISENLIKVDR